MLCWTQFKSRPGGQQIHGQCRDSWPAPRISLRIQPVAYVNGQEKFPGALGTNQDISSIKFGRFSHMMGWIYSGRGFSSGVTTGAYFLYGRIFLVLNGSGGVFCPEMDSTCSQLFPGSGFLKIHKKIAEIGAF